MTAHDPMTQPAGAPDQKARVLEWLQSEPEGLTQLQALQHLAVARLAAIVHRLKGDGHAIVTELVEMPTRYGPAQVARYHLVPKGGQVCVTMVADQLEVAIEPQRVPQYRCAVCCDQGKLRHGPDTEPCPAVGCLARASAYPANLRPCPVKLYEPDLALRDGAPTECDGNVPPGCALEFRDFDQAVRPPLDFDRLRREAGLD